MRFYTELGIRGDSTTKLAKSDLRKLPKCVKIKVCGKRKIFKEILLYGVLFAICNCKRVEILRVRSEKGKRVYILLGQYLIEGKLKGFRLSRGDLHREFALVSVIPLLAALYSLLPEFFFFFFTNFFITTNVDALRYRCTENLTRR